MNWFTKSLQVSDSDGGLFVLPRFAKYETIPLAITIVEPALNSKGLPRFSRVSIAALSLSVAINQSLDSATPLVQQPTWAKNQTENVFTAELAMGTAAMNGYIGSNATMPAFLEIEVQELTARSKSLIIPITLENAVTQVTTTAPAPLDEYLTKAQTTAQFAAKVMRPGEQFTLVSPGNVYQRVWGVDDGGNAIDQILPV